MTGRRRALPDAGSFARTLPLSNPGQFTALAERVARVLIWPLVRVLFRPRIEGLETLPDDRPYILVANHNAGAGIAEILSLLALFVRRFGRQRRLAGFALPLATRLFPLSWLLRQVGAVPSTFDAARQCLDQGVPLLVFPGGDHETLRPVWQARRCDFGGRTGFLRIARDANVPVIPMGIAGAHFTAPMLLRARWLAWFFLFPRLLGLKRYGISLLSLLGSAAILCWVPVALPWQLLLCWLWMGSPLVLLPWVPWSIRIKVGEPLDVAAWLSAGQPLEQVLGQVQLKIEGLIREA